MRPRHPGGVVDRGLPAAAAEPASTAPWSGPNSRDERLVVGVGELATRSRCRAASRCDDPRADAPQRVGRPVAHHLEPVLAGEPEHAARLAELGRDLGPHLGVADADRAVQPGRREHRRLHRRGPPPPGRRSRRRRTPRPSRAPRPRRPGRAQRRHHLAPTPRRRPDRRPAGTPRPGIAARRSAAASRSGRRSSRASYDAVETTAALGRVAAPPTTTGSPASSGRRSTSTAAMNWSRSTCSTQCCGIRPFWPDAPTPARLSGVAAPCRRWRGRVHLPPPPGCRWGWRHIARTYELRSAATRREGSTVRRRHTAAAMTSDEQAGPDPHAEHPEESVFPGQASGSATPTGGAPSMPSPPATPPSATWSTPTSSTPAPTRTVRARRRSPSRSRTGLGAGPLGRP